MNKRLLTGDERNELRKRHRAERDKRKAYRMNAVLLLDDGFSYEQIARVLFLDDETIRRWERQYCENGLEKLLENNYAGGHTRLTARQIEKLGAHIEAHLYSTAAEVCDYVNGKYRIFYTEQGMRDLLHRLNFVFKKTKLVPGKADIQKQEEFLKQYEALRRERNAKILFLDGVHPQHNSKPAHGWIKKGQEKQLRSNTGRKRINLNGALDPDDHKVILREDERINAQSTIKLLQQIESHYPNAPNIYCIADNAKYYRAKIVKEYLENSRLKLVFLPPYSPNLNLIERLWKFFYKKTIYNRYYETFAEFKTACLSFFENIDQHNEALNSLLTQNFQLISLKNSQT